MLNTAKIVIAYCLCSNALLSMDQEWVEHDCSSNEVHYDRKSIDYNYVTTEVINHKEFLLKEKSKFVNDDLKEKYIEIKMFDDLHLPFATMEISLKKDDFLIRFIPVTNLLISNLIKNNKSILNIKKHWIGNKSKETFNEFLKLLYYNEFIKNSVLNHIFSNVKEFDKNYADFPMLPRKSRQYESKKIENSNESDINLPKIIQPLKSDLLKHDEMALMLKYLELSRRNDELEKYNDELNKKLIFSLHAESELREENLKLSQTNEVLEKHNDELNEKLICNICFENEKNMFFDCGHMICDTCLFGVKSIRDNNKIYYKCPICREKYPHVKKVYH